MKTTAKELPPELVKIRDERPVLLDDLRSDIYGRPMMPVASRCYKLGFNEGARAVIEIVEPQLKAIKTENEDRYTIIGRVLHLLERLGE